MERKKINMSEWVKQLRQKITLYLNIIAHRLIGELKSIGNAKADKNASPQQTAVTHFRVLR